MRGIAKLCGLCSVRQHVLFEVRAHLVTRATGSYGIRSHVPTISAATTIAPATFATATSIAAATRATATSPTTAHTTAAVNVPYRLPCSIFRH